MRVHVDDAGRQREAAGVDRLGALVLDVADRGDAAVLDREVGTPGLVAQAVDDGGAAGGNGAGGAREQARMIAGIARGVAARPPIRTRRESLDMNVVSYPN